MATPHTPQEKQNQAAADDRAKRHTLHKLLVKWLWRGVAIGFVSVLLMFTVIAFNLPTFEQLENPNLRIASDIYAADGVELGKFFIENRTPVKYKDLSPFMVKALVATEDERFYDHSGIDAQALWRVAVGVFTGLKKGGGSTITQQLAKLLFKRPDVSGKNALVKTFLLGRSKFKEWLTAVKLERSYTKEEIIAMYLNEFNFINGAYGIKAAADIYFGKAPKDLNLEESALLVGMLQNPSLYNPKRFPERAMKRREVVLKQMQKVGFINRKLYDETRVKPLDMSKFKVVDHNEGLAPYFREVLREEVKILLAGDKCRKPDGSAYDIYNDGLKIYTTIDSRMQAHAEKAVRDHLSKHQEKLFKLWKDAKRDPWTYSRTVHDDPDYETLEVRQATLRREVQNADRYKHLYEKIMTAAIEEGLRTVDVERLYTIEKNGNKQVEAWLKTGYINKDLAKMYTRILDSDRWLDIKREKQKLEEAVKREFEKPVKMKVFAYNPAGEKDTTMTPLDSIKYHRFHLQTGFIAVDPQTGHIKAWVGGIDHRRFKYDHAHKGSVRQVGSTIKPFLYALSIEFRGYSPCQTFADVPTSICPGMGNFKLAQCWTPNNAGGGYSGASMTMIKALQNSVNSISTYLMKDLGSTEPMREYMAKVGIDTGYDARIGQQRVPAQPAICLGTPDLSVYEMVGGYTPFANKGMYTEPIFITRIVDRNGIEIYRAAPKRRRVLSEGAAYAMVFLLKNVLAGSGGFGGIKSEMGGKTGTTQYQSDGWFMGITPNLVAGTWVGNDDRFVRFEWSLYLGQGASMARPIFQNFMRAIEADKELAFNTDLRFEKPEETSIETNCALYDYSDGGLEEIAVEPEAEEGKKGQFGGQWDDD